MSEPHHWNYTTFIHCDNLVAIEQAISSLLEQEGGYRLNQLPFTKKALQKMRENNSWYKSCQLCWIVSIFPGRDGWTIVKTWSDELLCHRTSDNSRPRLSALAMALGCDAFYLGVYDGIFGMLLETNSVGEIYVVGCFEANFGGETFYQQPINLTDLIQQFSLINVPESFQAAMQINEHPQIKKKIAAYEQLRSQKNPDWGLLNKLWDDEVSIGHTERIDKALRKIIDAFGSWSYSNLAYAIYLYPDMLKAAKANLLYFQPPKNYKVPSAYTLTREQWLDIFGIEPPSTINN
jgi:hypothetical protein